MTLATPACSEMITTTGKPPAACTSEAVFLVGDPDGKVRTPCGVHIGVAMPAQATVYTVVRVDDQTAATLLVRLAAR